MTDAFPRIRSSLLAQFPSVVFAMSTRQGGSEKSRTLGFSPGMHIGREQDDKAEEQLSAFCTAIDLSPDEIVFMDQVHEDGIVEATEPGVYPATDAVMTNELRLALAVRTADCVPIMLIAPGENAIAAVHAGWRGSSKHLAMKTVEQMCERYQAEPEHLFAYIGPGAKSCCYEVDEETAALFPAIAVERRNNAKPLLDLQRANLEQLLHAGLLRENVEMDSQCTIHNTLFHSHRRDGDEAGRMLAVIYLRRGDA